MSALSIKKLTARAKRYLMRRAMQRTGAADIVARMRQDRLTYLNDPKFLQIIRSIQTIGDKGVPGDFIEAGCALGGSAIVIASLMPTEGRLFVHDVFGTIPPPTDEDPEDVHARYAEITAGQAKGFGEDTYYGYIHDLKTVVQSNLDRHLTAQQVERVGLVEGLVQDTLTGDRPVAFAHIDVDWYDPVKFCLEALDKRLSPGGTVVIDDYFDWGGCRKATDEFLETPVEPLPARPQRRQSKARTSGITPAQNVPRRCWDAEHT